VTAIVNAAAQAGLILMGASIAGVLLFALYPVALWVATRRLPPARTQAALTASGRTPSLSVIVAVRNGQEHIERKIRNALELDYPADRLEVIVVSDGSTDRTVQVIRSLEGPRVRGDALPDHAGKAAALNRAVGLACGEILVFSDADALLEPSAAGALVRHFADPRVGGVCGQRVISRDGKRLREAQAGYIRVDSAIKALESRLGRITSNDGKLYAVRRDLFRTIPPDVTDDLFSCLSVIGQGGRFLFEPQARAHVRLPSRSPAHEVQRRRRIVSRGLRGIARMRRLLNPFRYGVFALGLLINKVLRRLVPPLLIVLLGASALLAPHHPAAALLLVLQAAFYTAAASYPVLTALGAGGSVLRAAELPFYFCVGGWGTLLGLADFLRGRSEVRWDPKKSDATVPATDGAPRTTASPQAAARPGGRRPAIAYVMSRFPRITETFVLYEILELRRLGFRVEVYPLLRERAAVTHPEAREVAPFVRHEPLLSPRVLGAVLDGLARAPLRCVRTALEALRATAGSANHFFGALGILPKCLWMARDMERRGIGHIHAHFANHPATAAMIASRLSGIPFSFTAHGSDIHVDQRGLDRKIEASAFAVMISEYNRRFLIERFGERIAPRMRVVHCGVDPDVFAPPVRRGREHQELRILCVASFREVKGHRFLIDACRLLGERGVAFRCHLVGAGGLRREFARRIAEAGLRDRIVLHGALPRPEVLRMMHRCDVAVLPSNLERRGRREGIPVTLMEAMAAELPVVSSRLSGIPELVESGESGLLTPPGDAGAIADALEQLAARPKLRQQMGRAGREKVLMEFDLRRCAVRLAELFMGEPAGRAGGTEEPAPARTAVAGG
jgi:glycosyltransferase involved in cell wall biosynthesis